MSLRLRQICLVAADMPATEKLFADVLDLPVCFRDPAVGAFGLENILCQVGFSFLEVVVPTQEDTAGGRYIERRGGDGGYMVILQTSYAEHPVYRQRALDKGIRIAHEMDYGDFNGMQLHPRDVGAAILEIDRNDADPEDSMRPDQPWHPAGGTAWRDLPTSSLITSYRAAELQSGDPMKLAEHWADVLDRTLSIDAHANPCIYLDDCTLRFVHSQDGRGDGLGGLDLACRDVDAVLARAADAGLEIEDDTIMLCGMRLKLVLAA
ncbi:MAG: VOC family protein [Alphaproteobacteria bacterium]|jgi:hypothetical protein